MPYTLDLDKELGRTRVLAGILFLALAFLVVFLWRIQVLNASEYMSSLDRQSIRRVRLPGQRGVIYDRSGKVLADNRASLCLAIYIEELRQPGAWSRTVDAVESVIEELETVLGVERSVTREDIRNHIRRRLPLPFLAWKDLDQATLARWAESGVRLPGTDEYIEPVRIYPNGKLGAHVLGYIGKADPPDDPTVSYHYYMPELVGKYGVEEAINGELAGLAGGALIRVDASGFKHEMEEGGREPWSGNDVFLTLDSRIQKAAEDALEGEMGAVVVLDPRNGDILAMASSPSFDPNSFSPAISSSEWGRLNGDRRRPMFNRALTGAYPPGSTFKPLVAIAALENDRASPGTMFQCDGYFQLGGVRFRCWKRSGHGLIDMRKAIEQSCNAYFCQLGLECGYDRIYHMAEAVGFGHKLGVEINAEEPGLLPGNAWKLKTFDDAWRKGDTCNVSIGQGALLATPLQMASFAAAIANGGFVYRPRLILGENPSEDRQGELLNNMRWSAETMRVVRGGMYDVVQAETGTGKRAKLDGCEMGGKTGTAEYGPKEDRKKHAWMLAFAPFDNPRFAVAIVVENGVSGGVTAAPRVKQIMETALNLAPVTMASAEDEVFQ